MAAGAIACTAEGTNELVDRLILLTKIHVRYTIRLPEGADREKVDRALATHAAKCPTAKSLEGAVEVTWSADIV
jgi:uncharacterized OsmC-like protein